jgi:hypothetical protein
MPVLVFVLAGVTTLIAAGTWAAELRADTYGEDELERLAKDVIDRVLWALSDGPGGFRDLDGIVGANMSDAVREIPNCTGWLISVEVLHPWSEQVLLLTSEVPGTPTCTACESRLVNSVSEDHLCVLAEVTVIVWTCA